MYKHIHDTENVMTFQNQMYLKYKQIMWRHKSVFKTQKYNFDTVLGTRVSLYKEFCVSLTSRTVNISDFDRTEWIPRGCLSKHWTQYSFSIYFLYSKMAPLKLHSRFFHYLSTDLSPALVREFRSRKSLDV